MCRQHLLGEHVELHMIVGSALRGRSLAGFVAGGLIETGSLRERHEDLSAEMGRRGYSHRSPLPAVSLEPAGSVPRVAARAELARRCPACRLLQSGGKA
jgi:hypothetical protein